jgi:hypothetical protein
MLRLMLTLILYVGAGCPDPNAPTREHGHESR